MPSTPIQPSTTSASAGSRRVHERNDSPLNHQRRKAETAAARRMTHPKRVGKTTTRLWTRRSFIKSAYPNSSVTACRIRMLCRRLIDPTLSRRRLGDGADQENSIRRIVELRGSELVLPCGLAKARQCNRKYRCASRCSARQWQEKQREGEQQIHARQHAIAIEHQPDEARKDEEDDQFVRPREMEPFRAVLRQRVGRLDDYGRAKFQRRQKRHCRQSKHKPVLEPFHSVDPNLPHYCARSEERRVGKEC